MRMVRETAEETKIDVARRRQGTGRRMVLLLGVLVVGAGLLGSRWAAPVWAALQEPGPTPTPPPTSTPAASPTPGADGSVTYVVVAGDTLPGIAARFHVLLEDLYAFNDLTEDSVLEPGQVLVLVPGDEEAEPAEETTATPAASPTSGTTTLPAGVTVDEDGFLLHAVVEGDTLLGIAIQYDLTMEELLALNEGITEESVLTLGQQIIVGQQRQQPASTGGSTDQPAGAATATPAATATVTPLPTLTIAPPTATATAAATEAALAPTAGPTATAVEATLATPEPEGTGIANVLLPLGMAAVALLLVIGVLFVYLGGRGP